jgi:hypothetical protein
MAKTRSPKTKTADTTKDFDTICQEAGEILEALTLSLNEYTHAVSAMEKENEAFETITQELRQLAVSRGAHPEDWEEAITVRDRWEVEEKLLGRGVLSPPQVDWNVLQYCRNVLQVLEKYRKIFEKLAKGKVISKDEQVILASRPEIKQQLDNSLPFTDRPLSIAGGQELARWIDEYLASVIGKGGSVGETAEAS